MNSLSVFLNEMDWWGLAELLVTVAAALFCITFHELSHGLVAFFLGDSTAKNAGRLTMNPICHIDLLGLLMMLVAKVGWAKPVPVNMQNFKNPKRGMAVTALAGSVSNFLIAVVAIGLSTLIYHYASAKVWILFCLCFLSHVALLSVGLGVFNLIPLPPLDGSKILLSVLPDKMYRLILR